MLSQELFFGLCGFALVSSITPGPNNLMLMTSGTHFGFARTIPHMLGVGIGFVVMIILVGMGIGKIFDLVPYSHAVLRWGSVAYLVWLAWKIAHADAPSDPQEMAASGAKPMTFLQAAAFQWVNPKAWTMALMAVSAYVTPSAPILGLFVVALVFGAINLPSVSAWAYLGVKVRRWLANPVALRVFNWTMAFLLLASLYPVIMDGSEPWS